jgi:hypothetical protein
VGFAEMKYDDASWHYGGDFPTDLPRKAGSTHIALFLACAVLNGASVVLSVANDPHGRHSFDAVISANEN